jgi:hypothetical protein
MSSRSNAPRGRLPSTRRLATACAVVAGAGCSIAGPPQPMAPVPAHSELLARYQAAQANAARAGDERLSCDALEQQLRAVANDPALQRYAETAGAAAQRDQARLADAAAQAATQSAMTMIASMGGSVGATIAGSAMAARSSAQMVEARERMQERAEQTRQLAEILPQLLRGQRVIELAQERRCAWFN